MPVLVSNLQLTSLARHVSKIHPTVPEDNEMLACMRSMKEFFPSESEYTAPTGSSGPSSEPWDAVMQQESSTSSNDGFILNSNENIEYSSRSVFADIGESSFFSAEPERTAGLIYDVEAMIEQALRQDVEQFRASAAYSSFEQSLAVPVGPEIPSFGIV